MVSGVCGGPGVSARVPVVEGTRSETVPAPTPLRQTVEKTVTVSDLRFDLNFNQVLDVISIFIELF